MQRLIKGILVWVVIPILVLMLLFRFLGIYAWLVIAAFVAVIIFRSRSVVYQMMGSSQYSKGNMEQALLYYEKAIMVKNVNPNTKILYGFLLLKAGHLEKAETVLGNVLKSHLTQENKNQAVSNMALVEWKKGNLTEAITMLEELIKGYRNTAIYGSLGYMYLQAGDLDKALAFNMEAYDYNDSSAIILDNLAVNYHWMGNMEKAKEIFEKLIEKAPTFPDAYYNYARFLRDVGETQKALENVEKTNQYKLSFTSTITQEDIDKMVQELKTLL